MKRLIAAFLILVGFLSFAQEKGFRMMTYNIRYAGDEKVDGKNAWSIRKDMVAKMIRFNKADVIGVQETLKQQINDLVSLLPEMKWTGVGRDDGKEKGEFSAILYNSTRFTLLESSTFWLSETPEQPSTGWDAALPRIVTWAKLRENKSGQIYCIFNTHLDHMGQNSRLESSKLIVKNIIEIASALPVILTGDFNFTSDSEPYKILKNNFKDAEFTAEHGNYGTSITFNDFGRATEKEKIDFIFVNDKLKVLQHGIIGETFNGQYPSDHMPVIADISLL